MAFSKKIEIYLVNGKVDSIITAELSNWDVKVIKVPRNEVNECNLKEIEFPGIYFLFSKDEKTGKDQVYIGEAENVKDRLNQHINEYNKKNVDYYWTASVIVSSNNLHKTLLRYLENKFVKITKECNRYEILTKSTFKNMNIKDSDKGIMEEFIENTKITIGTLGYQLLQPLSEDEKKNRPTNQKNTEKGKSSKEDEEELFYFNIKDAHGKGRFIDNKFIVLKGSEISKTTYPSLSKKIVRLRNLYIKKGTIENFILKEDITFNSPSEAAKFLVGYSINGREYWINKEGETLKQIYYIYE